MLTLQKFKILLNISVKTGKTKIKHFFGKFLTRLLGRVERLLTCCDGFNFEPSVPNTVYQSPI